MSARVGDKVFFRHDGEKLQAQVTRVADDNTVDIVLHSEDGYIIGGIPDVKKAKNDHEQKTDGFWWPKA